MRKRRWAGKLFRATTLQLDLGSGHDEIRSFPVCVENFAYVLGYRSIYL